LPVRLEPGKPLGRQIEAELRRLIRTSAFAAGDPLPSTRSLAADLEVSRGVIVGAYAQLAAEGYLVVRQGAAPVVARLPFERLAHVAEQDVHVAAARFNLRADLPDLALFPRVAWLAAGRAALRQAADADLAYGEPFGSSELRQRLAAFLGRTRGTAGSHHNLGIHAGSTQALFTIANVLRLNGATRIGVEDPGHRWRTATLAASGLEIVPVPVDREGLRVDALDRLDAVVVSPEHSFPLGVTLSPERRRALVEWATSSDAIIVEHDYDAHFRYDRAPTAALQALAPEHVAYVGTASALLVPTIRLGWSILPSRLVEQAAGYMARNVFALPRLEQLALAEFIAKGYLDRQLRRARTAYKKRRDLVTAALPVRETAGGLFVCVPLAPSTDEARVLAAAREQGFALDGVQANAIGTVEPGLVIGFAASPEPSLRRALRALRATVRPFDDLEVVPLEEPRFQHTG
jgi:GntR family transcriptional regulator / MocR family aminotransferase